MDAFKFALAATAVGTAIALLWLVSAAAAFIIGRWCAQLLGWY